MPDPCVGAVLVYTTGTAQCTTIDCVRFTTSCTSNNVIVMAFGIAATAGQTVTSVTYHDSAAELIVAHGDGTDERLEVWVEKQPSTVACVPIGHTLSAAARFNLHVMEIIDVYPCEPFIDIGQTCVGAKSVTLSQDTLERYSLLLLAKMNSVVDPVDCGAFVHHKAATETSSGTASLNVQMETDVLVTQVDIDGEVVATSGGWQWESDTSNRSASALVLGIQGAQPSGIAPQTSPANAPFGVMALIQQGLTVGSAVLNDLSIHGVALRVFWSAVEATEGVFDWSYLDTQLDAIEAAGKHATIRVNMGGNAVPAWALVGVETISTNSPVMAVPWDPVMMARRKAVQTAMAARYNIRTPDFDGPVRGASCSFFNWKNDDWAIPVEAADLVAWTAAGYTTARALAAAQEYIAHCFSVWTHVPVLYMPYNGNGTLDAEAITLAEAVAEWAYNTYGGRFCLMRNNLKSNTPTYDTAVGTVWEPMRTYRATGVATQHVWRIKDDASYRQNDFSCTTWGGNPDSANCIMAHSISNSASFCVRYTEIYSPDLRDSAQRSAWEGQLPIAADALATARKTRRPRRRRWRENV